VCCVNDAVIEVPPIIARKAREYGLHEWLANLPGVVAELAELWQLAVDGVLDGGTEALVVAVTDRGGAPAVLKVVMPHHNNHELAVLRLVDGEGCVRLLADNEQRGALLLERLGPSMADLAVPFEQRLTILCDLAVRVWRPVPPKMGLPTGAEKARWLRGFILEQWESSGQVCSEHAVAYALGCAKRREAAHDARRARLVHGDVHQWNALRSSDGWALIDPEGLIAEPEYDLGVLMREDPVELVRDGPRQRSAVLAARTGLSETAIWEWGVVERVSTGLLATNVGLQPAAEQMLHAAEIAVAADPG
jgi:streptomycin 6-kinase